MQKRAVLIGCCAFSFWGTTPQIASMLGLQFSAMKRQFTPASRMLTLITSCAGLAVLAGMISHVRAQTPLEPQPQVEVKRDFVILYRPGSAWIKGKPFFEQKLTEHGGYMAKLLGEKKLVKGGPYLDNAGGMAIVKAADMKEANAILAEDPAVKSKVFEGTVHPWLVVFDEAQK